MKKRTIALLTALILSSLVVMGVGAYLKYEVLGPYQIAQDKNIVELPFLLMTDEALRYELAFALRGPQQGPATQPSEVPTTQPTEAPTTPPTAEPTTEPSTVPVTDPTKDAAHEHIYDITTVVDPNCISEGYTYHECSGCGHSYRDTPTEKTDHSYSSVVVDPTPEADGFTEHTCQVCGDSYRDTFVEYVPPYTGPEPIVSDVYPVYDFSYGAVSDEWFDDALFIGDSRTVGQREWQRSGEADYFCDVGMTVFSVRTSYVEDREFEKQTLETLLGSKKYGKVFISLGLNESASSNEAIASAYGELIDLIRELQPDAKIILQAILMVSKDYSDSYQFQPENLRSINEEIAKFADNSVVFYIDGNKYFTNAEGFLYRDISGDGCHFYANNYVDLVQWISFAVGQLPIE